jgi:RimJ/RimL family protein N-acetyltransferase
MQKVSVQPVHDAWAQLAEVPRLLPFQVLVRPSSMLAIPGWMGFLCIDNHVTVVVATPELAAFIRDAFGQLAAPPVTPEAILAQLPGAQAFGPATLFYALAEPALAPSAQVQRVPKAELMRMRALLSASDWDECAFDHVASDAFVIHDDEGQLVAACGYERWPAGIAHLCIATVARSRGAGLARQVGAAALASARAEGLLPQWRARPEPSKAVARALGFYELGFQLAVRIPEP